MLKYFSYETDPMLACPHCGDKGMVMPFLKMLDGIREDYRQPMIISSGYRCAHYNNQLSTTGLDGPHTTGRAVDVLVSGEDAARLLKIALNHGMTGIGVNQKGPHSRRFLHFDDLNRGLRPWIWSY